MKNLIDKFVLKRHYLILDEADVLNVLDVIMKHQLKSGRAWSKTNMRVGNCGWVDDKTKWFIHFTTSEEKWYDIRHKLNIIRVWDNRDIPENTNGNVYATE